LSLQHALPASEALLIHRLCRREEAALSLLYDNYSAALYGVILRMVKSEADAEEVTQEVFLRIWTSIAQYDPGKGRLFTWMIQIARHAAIDRIRSKQYRVGSKTGPLEKSQVYHLAAANEFKPDHIGLKEIVEKLSPDQRKIIDLLYFDGFTQSEVAEELAIPLGTVKTRARAAIKYLTQLLR
jgi:RNA polymerase sigma factor (sigma-70 family)